MKYLIWLCEICGLQPAKILKLYESCGSPENIWRLSASEAALIGGLTEKEAGAFADKSLYKAEKILDTCKSRGIKIISIFGSAYPGLLKEISDPPIVLYVRGRLPSFDDFPSLTVVGHRHAGAYGLVTARNFAGALSKRGFIIVSGMAKGVDAAAHRGALEGGSPTVAVLGTAIDRCYPKENIGLMRDIIAHGAVISEYPPGRDTSAHAFPYRNRIMSGLTLGTLVCEAPLKSGALITADHALAQGREVFAVPGNIDDRFSAGCNSLIKSGARLVTDPGDIILEYGERYELLPEPAAGEAPVQPAPKPEKVPAGTLDDVYRASPAVDKKYLPLLESINGITAIDDIVSRSGISAAKVSAYLTILEVKGFVKRHPGGTVEKLV